MNALLAVGPIVGWSWGEILIGIVVLAAVCAVVYVALQQFGITIPPWVIRIFWIVVVCIVAVFAIRFLLSL